MRSFIFLNIFEIYFLILQTYSDLYHFEYKTIIFQYLLALKIPQTYIQLEAPI